MSFKVDTANYKPEEQETIYTMLIGLESTSEELLVDIICSTSNRETVNLAMKHKNFTSMGLGKLLVREDLDSNIAQELLDNAYKKLDEIKDENEWTKLCVHIVNSPMTSFDRLEEIFKNINKNMNDFIIRAKENGVGFQWDEKDYKILYFINNGILVSILVLISVHPNSNIDLSNKVYEILEEIGECELDEVLDNSLIENSNMCSYFFEGKFDAKENDGYKKYFPYTPFTKFNNLPCMANVILLEFLKLCKFYGENEKKFTLISSGEKKLFLDFIFDDNTTDELIQKILLERFDEFLCHDDESSEMILNSRFVSLLLSIISDERFKEKKISIELIKKIITNVKNIQPFIMNILKQYRQLIPFVLFNRNDIAVPKWLIRTTFEDNGISKDETIEIAKTASDDYILCLILGLSVYSKDCLEIIWNRRNEFSKDKKNIYIGVLECMHSTKEMLKEVFEKGNNDIYDAFAIFTILNPNIYFELYQKIFSFSRRKGYVILDAEKISYIENYGFSDIKVFEGDRIHVMSTKMDICYYLFECVISADDINQELLVKHLKELGDDYLKAYYRLLDFKRQSQTLELESKGGPKLN